MSDNGSVCLWILARVSNWATQNVFGDCSVKCSDTGTQSSSMQGTHVKHILIVFSQRHWVNADARLMATVVSPTYSQSTDICLFTAAGERNGHCENYPFLKSPHKLHIPQIRDGPHSADRRSSRCCRDLINQTAFGQKWITDNWTDSILIMLLSKDNTMSFQLYLNITSSPVSFRGRLPTFCNKS